MMGMFRGGDKRMMLYVLAGTLCTTGLLTLAWVGYSQKKTSPPVIGGNVIRFHNGKTITYRPLVRLVKKAEDAIKPWRPVELRESARIIPEWERIALVELTLYYEGGNEQVTLFDYQGTAVSEKFDTPGHVTFLTFSKRIFASGVDQFGRMYTEPLIFDHNGRLVAKLPNLKKKITDITFTDDGRLILIRWNKWVVDVWPSVVEIYDYNGRFLKSLEGRENKKIPFEQGGKVYSIEIHEPTPPL